MKPIQPEQPLELFLSLRTPTWNCSTLVSLQALKMEISWANSESLMERLTSLAVCVTGRGERGQWGSASEGVKQGAAVAHLPSGELSSQSYAARPHADDCTALHSPQPPSPCLDSPTPKS